ncbi:MAG: 2-oxoglutarate dehydrogenase E1 component [Actinobacteria bacterium]|nr:2-oxoglutarate dehydrogenase E1 component [Actinomycetota bacterium]
MSTTSGKSTEPDPLSADSTGTWRPRIDSPDEIGPLPSDVTPEELLTYMSAGMSTVKAYRTHGHLAAHLDPLGSEPPGDPALDPSFLGLDRRALNAVPATPLRTYTSGDTLGDVLDELREIYCGAIAYEIEHLRSHRERVWLREAIESRAFWLPGTPEERRRELVRLLRVEGLEAFLRRTFIGTKQFSIEGLDTMILLLDEAVLLAARDGVEDVTVGMAHRGRLNVLAHILRLPYAQILAEFAGETETNVHTLMPSGGTGDVKYHYGATGQRNLEVEPGVTRDVRLALLPNPSHLEFINPVVMGRTRALQTDWAPPSETLTDPARALAIQIHGDAAFPGQGVVAETLNLQQLDGYRIGGSLHVIADNQVGFTTNPSEGRSTRHCSDIAKGYDVPIIHVNADDVDACRAAIRLAMAYRGRFGKDVLVDLIGYRRWGHNEGDEPAYTQPMMYRAIKDHPPVAELYAATLIAEGVVTPAEVDEMREHVHARLKQALEEIRVDTVDEPMPTFSSPSRTSVETKVPAAQLRRLTEQLLEVPEGFTVNEKLAQVLERRRAALEPDGRIEWGHAEALAYATLLEEGVPIRLTGQDSERGTFAHRHAVLHDAETGARHTPLQRLNDARAGFEVHNAPLTETGCLGFEYGYATTRPDSLVLWEAQFGDFVNVAQVIVDQFIMSGRTKWGDECRLTLLLPHGYEGSGPEHSSARLERFLKLAAEDNCTIAYPTTAAQFFHLVRRQSLAPERRPLIVMTPKSLLRLKEAASTLEDLADGTFTRILDDPDVKDFRDDISRAILCSGKVFYDIKKHPDYAPDRGVAVIRLEQLYPFPTETLARVLSWYPNLEEIVWAQEEPANMGAWRSIRHRLEMAAPGVLLRYAGRPWRASPSEGYPPDHLIEQERLVRDALGLPPR